MMLTFKVLDYLPVLCFVRFPPENLKALKTDLNASQDSQELLKAFLELNNL